MDNVGELEDVGRGTWQSDDLEWQSRPLGVLRFCVVLTQDFATSNPRVAGSTPARRTSKSITCRTRNPNHGKLCQGWIVTLWLEFIGEIQMHALCVGVEAHDGSDQG